MPGAPSPPLRIACHLRPAVVARIAAHPSRPIVDDYTGRGEPWDIPPDADLLFMFTMDWTRAPATPPAGWPYRLRWIQVASAGVDRLPAWFFGGPVVTCGRGISSAPIAEYVMTAILAQAKRWPETRATSRAQWRGLDMRAVAGQTLGLVGVGSIGREIARRALAFGMNVIALRRSPDAPLPEGVTRAASLADLLATADHVAIAAPLTPATRHLIDAAALAHAKPGLHLVNIARGGIVDQDALLAALDAGRVGAATLDVTDPEPLPAGHPLYTHPRAWITPHLSWGNEDADGRIADKLLANLDRYLRGEPLTDVVDVARGY